MTSDQLFIPTQEDWEKQRRELTDSLHYASYIQAALFPSRASVSRWLKEYFVFFRPRDLVSGDFYWFGRYKKDIIIAAADCTGHGIPGAFMSILGISFLNEIVSRGCFTNASGILNQLRERVMKALHQTGESNEQKDGMDISLCLIETRENILHFAGANNPLYIIRNNELREIKGDRMPIGINVTEEKTFSNHSMTLHEDDMICLFTDGFPDQFGGREGKKLKYKPFKELLIWTSAQPVEEQEAFLDKQLYDWMGATRQIDDILVLGIRYKPDQDDAQ